MNPSSPPSAWGRAALIALATTTSVAAGGAAWADPDGGPENYVPASETTVVVQTPTCDTGSPTLAYVVTEPGATDVDITWVNPSGANILLDDQPLSGTLDWPRDSWASGTVTLAFDTTPTEVVSVSRPACDTTGAGGAPSPAQPSGGTEEPAAGEAGAHEVGDQASPRSAEARSGSTQDASGKSSSGSLPVTGAQIALYGGLTLATIGIGAGTVVVARRRRTSV